MTPYEVLRVPGGATTDELRAAYLARARESHPDRAGGSDDEMRRVNEAWAVLSDPVRKADFDRSARRAGGTENADCEARGRADRAAGADPRPRANGRNPRYEDLDPDRFRRPTADEEGSGASSFRALVPLALLVLGGSLILFGAALGIDLVNRAGVLVVVLGVLGFITVPLISLSESRRADGPQ